MSSAILLTDLSAATRRNVSGTREEGRGGRGREGGDGKEEVEGGREGGREGEKEGGRERYMYMWSEVRKKSDVIKHVYVERSDACRGWLLLS